MFGTGQPSAGGDGRSCRALKAGKALPVTVPGQQIPEGNLTGAAPGILKPIKSEIAEWGEFLNKGFLHYLFYLSANSYPDSVASSAGAQRAQKLGRRRLGVTEILPVIVKKSIKNEAASII